ncbi:MAG: methyltransferase family protein [bacterium]
MYRNKTLKGKAVGGIMPFILSLVIMISHVLFNPSHRLHPLTFLLLVILAWWGFIEIREMKGDSRVQLTYFDLFLKTGMLSGVLVSVVLGDIDYTFITLLGFISLILGIILRKLAIQRLGVHFSYSLETEGERQPIIVDGVYKYIRHPSYLGIFMIILSFSIIYINLPGFLIEILFLWLYVRRRISLEEKMMINTFGDRYRNYMRGTKKMIPFLY